MRWDTRDNTAEMSNGNGTEADANCTADCACGWHDHGSTERVTNEAHAHTRDHALGRI